MQGNIVQSGNVCGGASSAGVLNLSVNKQRDAFVLRAWVVGADWHETTLEDTTDGTRQPK